MKIVIIQGSARSQGDTHKVVNQLQHYLQADFIDLKTYHINHFDYDFIHREDDFLPLMRQLVNYDLLIFATPVYWYAMSSIMKAFFDRITDCLKIEKETGRKLRGKSMAMLSCGSDGDLKEGFDMPFRESAAYLGMNYKGSVHTWIEEDEVSTLAKENLQHFAKQLQSI